MLANIYESIDESTQPRFIHGGVSSCKQVREGRGVAGRKMQAARCPAGHGHAHADLIRYAFIHSLIHCAPCLYDCVR